MNYYKLFDGNFISNRNRTVVTLWNDKIEPVSFLGNIDDDGCSMNMTHINSKEPILLFTINLALSMCDKYIEDNTLPYGLSKDSQIVVVSNDTICNDIEDYDKLEFKIITIEDLSISLQEWKKLINGESYCINSKSYFTHGAYVKNCGCLIRDGLYKYTQKKPGCEDRILKLIPYVEFEELLKKSDEVEVIECTNFDDYYCSNSNGEEYILRRNKYSSYEYIPQYIPE